MRKIGILGGLGPESTLDYYKTIIGTFNRQHRELAYPEIIVYSANLNAFMQMVTDKDWPALVEWLLERIRILHNGGADFVAMASNTPHIVFEEVSAKAPLPLLSIVEATCSRAQTMGLKKIGLLGTSLTMEADFYKKPFVLQGINVVVPTAEEQQLIHHRLFSEIELGVIKESTRDELLAIIKRMREEQQIDSVVLGCTELPLLLTEDMGNIPFLNTSAIHCETIIKHCINDFQAGSGLFMG